MATSARDRLNRLFGDQALPANNDPSQVHFSEMELRNRHQASIPSNQVIADKSENPPPKTGSPEAAPNVERLSDSDDDDYTNAFANKPSMRSHNRNERSGPRNRGTSDAVDHSMQTRIAQRTPPEYLPIGRSSRSPSFRQPENFTDAPFETNKAPILGRFCPFILAAKFPYKYMNDGDDRVSKHFFADNKFYARSWDLYYVDPPATLYASKPIVLVPFDQAQQLVGEISKQFGIRVSVPQYPFTLTFHDDGTPVPKYLGKSSSREMASQLQSSIPPSKPNHGESPEDASPTIRQAFTSFRQMCEDVIGAGKAKSKGKAKSQSGKKPVTDELGLLSSGNWAQRLRKTQRYLGLRPPSKKVETPDQSLSWEDQENFRIDQEKEAGVVLEPFDVTMPTPYAFDQEPIIISLDLEAYERAHHLITEVGVSVLDTLDLVDLPPGTGATNWIDQIRSRHFRIKGRENLVNKDFCPGNPDHFQFGESEFIDLADIGQEVDKCFEWPFSVQYKHAAITDEWEVTSPANVSQNTMTDDVPDDDEFGGVKIGPTNSEQDVASRVAATNVLHDIGATNSIPEKWASPPDPIQEQRGGKQRNILIVGHAISGDLEFLKNLGSKIFSSPRPSDSAVTANDGAARVLPLIIDKAFDTAQLYKAWKQDDSPRKLSIILKELGRPCYYMHNGGNDARYTLEALIAMALQARLEEDGAQTKPTEATRIVSKAQVYEDSRVFDYPRYTVEYNTSAEGKNVGLHESWHNSQENETNTTTIHKWHDGWDNDKTEGLPASVTGHGRAVFASSLPIVQKINREDLDDFEAALYATSDSDA